MKDTFKIGLEIEYKNAKAKDVLQGLRNNGLQSDIIGYHQTNNFSQWNISYDQTVSEGRGQTMKGGEIVSPILTQDNLNEIDVVCKVLQDANAKINYRCGLHIHFSWENMCGSTIVRILKRYQRFESQFDSIQPDSRKTIFSTNGDVERENGFCRTTKNIEINHLNDSQPIALERVARLGERNGKINLRNLHPSGRTGTIEFRHHSGTTNAFKVKMWIMFLMDFIAESENKKGTVDNFDANKMVSPSQRKRAFGVMKYALEHYGVKLKQIRKFGFEFSYNFGVGTNVKRMSYDQVYSDLYTSYNRKTAIGILSFSGFNELLKALNVSNSQVQDNMFDGVSENVEYYFKGRADRLDGV